MMIKVGRQLGTAISLKSRKLLQAQIDMGGMHATCSQQRQAAALPLPARHEHSLCHLYCYYDYFYEWLCCFNFDFSLCFP